MEQPRSTTSNTCMVIIGLRGKFQIAICHIAMYNLWKRLNLAGLLIGQLVKKPENEIHFFGTRGLIVLEILNIILTTCVTVQYYLEISYMKLVEFCSTLLVIFYIG